MGLEQNAFTVASHLTMVTILFVLAYRILTLQAEVVIDVVHSGLQPAVAITCLALALERCYYVVARFVIRDGLNLWTLHPAPEVLSLIVGIGLFVLMIPLRIANAARPQSVWYRVAAEGCAYIGLWGVLAGILY